MKLISALKRITVSLICSFTRVKVNRVYFSSFAGTAYSDNPRYISEALHKMSPETEIVWGFKNPDEKKKVVPDYVKCVDLRKKISSARMLFSSAVIVENGCLPSFKKSPKQFFIQTWHGDRAFKKVLYASSFIPKNFFTPESKDGYCDLAVAGSEYGKMQYITAFRYNGEILMEGTPRDDLLVKPDEHIANEVKTKLGIPSHKKLLLYAPTLRRDNAKNNTLQQIPLDIVSTLDALNGASGEDWMCLVRAHPTICGFSNVEYGKNILNVSKWEDMSELLLISDMLITDYSSCAGDFALLGRPIVLFQPDVKEYLEKDRDFYFEMSESPYYMAENQQVLENIIEALDEQDVKRNCQIILDFYKTYESGNASEKVAEIIVNWIKNKVKAV